MAGVVGEDGIVGDDDGPWELVERLDALQVEVDAGDLVREGPGSSAGYLGYRRKVLRFGGSFGMEFDNGSCHGHGAKAGDRFDDMVCQVFLWMAIVSFGSELNFRAPFDVQVCK